MKHLHINLTANLYYETNVSYLTTDEQIEEQFATAKLKQRTHLGEIKIIIPAFEQNDMFSESERYELFRLSDNRHKFVRFVLNHHPDAQEVLEDLEVRVNEMDIEIEKLEGTIIESEETVWAAAKSTENPKQTLLEYATLRDSVFSSLPVQAKQLLESRLTDESVDG